MTELTLDTKLTIPPQVMARLVDGETVLLDLESGTYFGVDGVGQRIWDAVGEGKSLGAVSEVIVAEYEVDARRAEADVIAFVGELVGRGLLDLAES